MSTLAPTLDVSGTPGIPFLRLLGVELRKMRDTRAGLWLLGLMIGLTALVMVIVFFVADSDDRVFETFLFLAAIPQGFILPVLGILLITQEWGQRTAMVTFALEPSRAKVVGAKVAAALVLAVIAYVAAIVIAALLASIGGASDKFDGASLPVFGLFFLVQLFGMVMGLAFGLIFLNTPAAIVSFFVVPNVSTFIFNIVPGLRDAAPWVDINTAQQPLFSLGGGENLTGEEWAHLGTTTLVWIVLPFVLGLVRVMRAELK